MREKVERSVRTLYQSAMCLEELLNFNFGLNSLGYAASGFCSVCNSCQGGLFVILLAVSSRSQGSCYTSSLC